MTASLGFASELKSQQKKLTTKKTKGTQLESIFEVHANLLTYLEDVPATRVKKTQKHMLKDTNVEYYKKK